jgi:hypothetical protein
MHRETVKKRFFLVLTKGKESLCLQKVLTGSWGKAAESRQLTTSSILSQA